MQVGPFQNFRLANLTPAVLPTTQASSALYRTHLALSQMEQEEAEEDEEDQDDQQTPSQNPPGVRMTAAVASTPGGADDQGEADGTPGGTSLGAPSPGNEPTMQLGRSLGRHAALLAQEMAGLSDPEEEPGGGDEHQDAEAGKAGFRGAPRGRLRSALKSGRKSTSGLHVQISAPQGSPPGQSSQSQSQPPPSEPAAASGATDEGVVGTTTLRGEGTDEDQGEALLDLAPAPDERPTGAPTAAG
ncbi:hypothetical protein PAPYR_8904 [Paratrimastix pyriformis]|uniref:Uncharacterized protein n=1 Tax=Paratrimastix pyriformis TaxID=342808 RepID=A0ABQ8UGQ7_9EUKA|nr:hypothetical protein PAPYR_8904 [Paratrimastix pyriformis]